MWQVRSDFPVRLDPFDSREGRIAEGSSPLPSGYDACSGPGMWNMELAYRTVYSSVIMGWDGVNTVRYGAAGKHTFFYRIRCTIRYQVYCRIQAFSVILRHDTVRNSRKQGYVL